MKPAFLIRPEVKNDIQLAVDYYKTISLELAKQFVLRLREAKVHIELNPKGFQIAYQSTRTLLLQQFPYHIHYLIDEEKNRIVIIAIIHAYKNPQDYSIR
jgi:plasmid stabilization system protein ParE